MGIYALIIVKNLVITMDKRRLTQLGLALFVGLIFISSYISLVNYNAQLTSTTTAAPAYYAIGFSNATITGYGGPLYFDLASGNATVRAVAANIITSNLTILEDNSSVLNFYTAGRNISVEPENMSAYDIYLFISSRLNGTVAQNITVPYATAYALLPQTVNFTVGTQAAKIPIPSAYSNQSFISQVKYGLGSQVRVKITTFITQNGTISGSMNLIVV